MNREIKFRAWLKNENRMITNISSIKVDIQCIYYDNNQMFSYDRASFDEIELMQYTGLTDKNGVEIYEGDIVKRITLFKAEILESINCVEFEKGCVILKNPSLTNHLFLCEEYELEVIGNIYENKELLKNG